MFAPVDFFVASQVRLRAVENEEPESVTPPADDGAWAPASDAMGLDEGLKPDTWIAALAGGLVMGVIHVVTGADHLSAVAMLSSGNDRWTAWNLGIRWGMGHCVGLLAVFAAVLIASAELDKTSVRGVEEYMGVVVGLLMIGLGAYGLWDASRVTTRCVRSCLGFVVDEVRQSGRLGAGRHERETRAVRGLGRR